MAFAAVEPTWRELHSIVALVTGGGEVRLATTPHGFLFLNDVLTAFMQD